MISDLRNVAHFADTVASRGWHAWWQDSPVPLSEYRTWVQEAIDGKGVPTCLVVHDGETYQGSVKLIARDMDARPNYTPWIAALWVDESFRRQGNAQNLITAARKKLHSLGIEKAYLCATETNSPYYRARGFTQIETDVDGLNVFVIAST
jgi:GNAT superfamily N-acetyltransferase